MSKTLAQKRAYYRAAYHKHKERYAPAARARMKLWRTANIPQRREKKWAEQGIIQMTWERYLTLLKQQDYTCLVCSKVLSEASANVDHDHTTGVVRGLLCGNCNRALGLFGDSSKVCQKAANYLSTFEEGT